MHPLLRVGPKGGGEFRRIGWDEALDRVAAAFREAAGRHGAEAVWPFNSAGTMGLVNRDGIARLTHVMGYSRRKPTICVAVCVAGWTAGVGRIAGPDAREMADSELIVVWGGNPVATQVNVTAHVSRARKQGARLVVVDPYRTGTAAVADMHLALRPGTDGALACAVLHVLFRDGHADRAYMAHYADDPAGLEAHVATRTPEWAAGITGLAVAEIEAFAALYGVTKRAFIRCGFGHPDGRFRFRPDWAALGPDGAAMPGWPDHWDAMDAATDAHPFRLMAPPARQFLNTTFNQVEESRRREVRPSVLVHPDDAARLGIADGDRVALHARVGGGMQPGVLVVEGVWSAADFDGVGINALTSGAVFHDTAV